MKKFIAVALSSALALTAFAGCGSSSDSDNSSSKKTAKVIDIDLTDEQYAFGVDKTQPDLLEEVNSFIAEMNEDGTFAEICNHYFGDGEPVAVHQPHMMKARTSL
jgi:polar amino acid transport system substrate-binding protein